MTYVVAVVAAVLGVGALVYGEADDSPGMQGIGVVLMVAAAAVVARKVAARR